jgi:hypothetical protein
MIDIWRYLIKKMFDTGKCTKQSRVRLTLGKELECTPQPKQVKRDQCEEARTSGLWSKVLLSNLLEAHQLVDITKDEGSHFCG